MWTIIWQRGLSLKRDPKNLILMFLFPIFFTFVFSNMGGVSKIEIPYYSEEQTAFTEEVVSFLNRSPSFHFTPLPLEKMKEEIAEGRAEVGLILPKGLSTGFDKGNVEIRLMRSKDSTTLLTLQGVLQSSLQQMSLKKKTAEAVTASLEKVGVERSLTLTTRVEGLLNDRWASELPVSTEVKTQEGQGDFRYDPTLQSALGFTLFSVFYSIVFSISAMLEDLRQGIWNRMMISPLGKGRIYLGNFLYSFFVGYGQILILMGATSLLFGVHWGGSSGIGPVLFLLAIFTVTIAAFGMLLSGLVRNPQQLNAVVPLFAVSFAMLGGAFWPLEIITSPVLLAIAKVIPIYYPMNAIKEILLYQQGWNVVWLPTAVLLLMTILFAGVGLPLMERKRA